MAYFRGENSKKFQIIPLFDTWFHTYPSSRIVSQVDKTFRMIKFEPHLFENLSLGSKTRAAHEILKNFEIAAADCVSTTSKIPKIIDIYFDSNKMCQIYRFFVFSKLTLSILTPNGYFKGATFDRHLTSNMTLIKIILNWGFKFWHTVE